MMAMRMFSAVLMVMFLWGCATMNTSCTKVETIKEIGRDGRFMAYDDGTVLDTKTNLMWAAVDNGKDITWKEAKLYCENYQAGGYTDWRLPTLDELEGLYDEQKDRPAKCTNSSNIHLATALIDVSCLFVWASETSFTTNESGIFDFDPGIRSGFARSWHQLTRVLPVRSFPWYSFY